MGLRGKPKTKDLVVRCISLDRKLGERLDAYAEKVKLSKTAVIELALYDYLDNVEAEENTEN